MATTFQKLLAALGIKKIYWIDDKFYDRQKYTADTIANAVVEWTRAGQELPQGLEALAGYVVGVEDEGLVHQGVFAYISDLEASGQREEIAKIYRVLDTSNAISDEDALSDAGFEGLMELFGAADLKTLSFSDWVEKRAELDTGDESLYIVDFENKIDEKAAGLGGKEVLDYLSGIDVPPFSVVLTHVCEPSGETARAGQIFSDLRKKDSDSFRRFSVMSKKRMLEGTESIDEMISPPFKRLAVNQMYRRVAENCLNSMKVGLSEGISQLNDLPVEELEQAIFARSSEEGVSEPEVISRILGIAQRKRFFSGVQEILSKPETNYFKQLTQLRDLKSVETPVDEFYREHRTLEELRYAELIDDGDFINPLSAPLSCGDVFQKWSDGGYNGSMYVFLASPCDLMVRDTGKRSINVGVIASIKWKGLNSAEDEQAIAGEAESANGRERLAKPGEDVKRFEIPIGASRGRLVVDFRTSTTVNLQALEICVGNRDGLVKYKYGQRHPNVLLSGWRKRFQELDSAFERNGNTFSEEFKTLCMFDPDFQGMRVAAENQKEIDFKLKRQFRIRSPYAEAILNAYLQSIARPAFDHNFAGRR
ncbi:hypothetical protein [Ralstonia pseudosolanacearum]|uniref:hypothetical protein n=1 Tax=Ralstonia pseudosolanacearum TaxID=1310165 RepID=UPI003864C1B3